MIEWSEQHQMIRDAVRRFVEEEIAPNLEELEHGDTPPYDVLRKLISAFGMGGRHGQFYILLGLFVSMLVYAAIGWGLRYPIRR